MAQIPDNKPENKEPAEGSRETVEASLQRNAGQTPPQQPDESSETPSRHGPTQHRSAAATPDADPDAAASGRRAPDALGAAEPHDPLKTGSTDVNRR